MTTSRLVAAASLVLLLAPAGVAAQDGRAAIIVNTLAGDNDGTCGTNAGDASADCSLLEALAKANADAVADQIVFSVAGTIQPDAPLVVTSPVVIDGTTNGRSAGDIVVERPLGSGAVIRIEGGGDKSGVRGLSLVGATDGLNVSGASGVELTANRVGTAPGFCANGGTGIVLFEAKDASVSGNEVGRYGNGFYVQGADGSVVQNNRVGLNAAGDDRAPCTDDGTAAGSGLFVQFTGPVTVRGNTIGYYKDGVALNGVGGVTVADNFIGVSQAGGDLIRRPGAGASGSGVVITSVGGVTVSGNTIGLYGDNGVFAGGDGLSGSTISGNRIGANRALCAAGGSGGSGLSISGASANGTDPVVVSGNTVGLFNGNGFFVSGASGTLVIRENLVGTDSDGGDLGPCMAGGNGLFLDGTTGLVVEGNTVGRYGSNGFYVQGETTGAQIRSNRIGIAEDGSNIGTGGTGILVGDGAVISLLGNAIANNADLGIGLGFDGVTANDVGDGDTGPNGLQNFPIVSSATTAEIRFVFNSSASAAFRVDLFASSQPDPSGYGEGARFLGSASVTTDASGNATGTYAPSDLAAGAFVTATATPVTGSDPATFGGTSEFSLAVAVQMATPNEPGVSALAVSNAWPNPARGRVSLRLSIPSPTPVRVDVYDALGRLVMTPFDGVLAEAGTVDMDASGLAPGAYVLRVTGASLSETRSLTVVR